MKRVLDEGELRSDRTGTGTISLFGESIHHDMRDGFPLLTTKKMHWKSIVHELLWFISGDTNVKYLNDNGVTIWDEWADEKGDLGPVYGKQWRDWDGYIDQLAEAIEKIRTDPDSRRIIVSAWNPSHVVYMALAPCHTMFQFYCHEDNGLSLQMYQRSADLFLGVPFNIASYALLLKMVAHVTGRQPRDLHICFGDVHIYKNHVDQCKIQLGRLPRMLPSVMLQVPGVTSIDDFTLGDIMLDHYSPHPGIKASISI